jgi:plasmid stabilization system protein ParE
MKLVWTAQAVADLVEIADYVSEHHPDAAIALRDRLRSVIEGLADFPMAGRPGRVAETRRVLGLAFSACLNAPVPETRFGVFRM